MQTRSWSERFRKVIVLLAALAAVVGVGGFLGVATYEFQVAVVIVLVVSVVATYLIPRAAARTSEIPATWLALALAAKLGATVLRYVMLQLVFGGGDAVSYHAAGVEHYQMVRSFDFGFIENPYFGTAFIDDAAAFVYALIGPSMLGAFFVFSTLSFVGCWLLYRAHRLSFPGGDARLYFLLIFFLPTMAFWPSSLGKDALVVFGLGLGTWGLAKLLQRSSLWSLLQMLLGTALTFGVRPAVGVMFLAGAAVAWLLHPGTMRSPLSRPISWAFVGPIVVAGLVLATGQALTYEQLDASGTSLVEQYVATHERLIAEGGSVIAGPAPTSPSGFGQAVITVLFRPFPWELSTPLAALAGLESLVILYVVVLRLPTGWRGIRQRWRGGMVICAVIVSVSLIVPLTAVANFGLLVRQRAQLLPFLFMVLTAVARRPRRRSPASSPYLAAAPRQAAATPG